MYRLFKSAFYIIAGTSIGFMCLNLFQPNPVELEKIKQFGQGTNTTSAYSAAVQVAAKSKEPIYRQSSAQIQKQVMEAHKEITSTPQAK